MSQSDLTVRIDDDLKASGEELLRNIGVSWSAVFSAFISYSVKQGKIPAEIDNELNGSVVETEEEYYTEIRRRVADLDAGINCAVHELIEVDD